MKTVTINVSPNEIDGYVKSRLTGLRFSPFALFSVGRMKRSKDKLKVYGYFYSAKGQFIRENDADKLVLELNVSLALKAVFLVVYLFLGVFLFYDKVTINGQSDPSMFERIKFVVVGVIAWTIPLVLLSFGIERFGRKLKSDIEEWKNQP